MKRVLFAVALASATFITPAFADDVGVSVSIGQPGFYGRIDIGGYPAPRVIYRQPRVVERVYEVREPIYLRVPPGHRKHWSRHCHEYDACGERVYFVQDSWYNHEYAPRYQEGHREHDEDYRDERQDDHRESHQYDEQEHHHGNKNRGHGDERDHH